MEADERVDVAPNLSRLDRLTLSGRYVGDHLGGRSLDP